MPVVSFLFTSEKMSAIVGEKDLSKGEKGHLDKKLHQDLQTSKCGSMMQWLACSPCAQENSCWKPPLAIHSVNRM